MGCETIDCEGAKREYRQCGRSLGMNGSKCAAEGKRISIRLTRQTQMIDSEVQGWRIVFDRGRFKMLSSGYKNRESMTVKLKILHSVA